MTQKLLKGMNFMQVVSALLGGGGYHFPCYEGFFVKFHIYEIKLFLIGKSVEFAHF